MIISKNTSHQPYIYNLKTFKWFKTLILYGPCIRHMTRCLKPKSDVFHPLYRPGLKQFEIGEISYSEMQQALNQVAAAPSVSQSWLQTPAHPHHVQYS